MNNERYYWLDNLRAFLIMIVVGGHCIQFTNADYEHNMVFRVIYSFHMPLFIYVSGYASGLSIINWDKIKRRAVQLLIPFFNFAVLNSFLHRDNELLNWILFPEKGLWFLWALFFITQIHLLCHKVSSYLRVREEIIVIIAIIFLFSSMRFTNLFGYSIVCKYFIFYILGVYSRRRGWITLIKGKTVQILLLALFLFSISFFRLSENPTFCAAGASSLYKLIYNPLVAILGIMAIVPIFKKYVTDNMWITKIGGVKHWEFMRYIL